MAQAALYPVGHGPSVTYGTSEVKDGGAQRPDGSLLNCEGVGMPYIFSNSNPPFTVAYTTYQYPVLPTQELGALHVEGSVGLSVVAMV